MHQTMASQLQSLIHHNPPQIFHQANEIIDMALAATIPALRTAAHNTLHTTHHFTRIYSTPFIAELQNLQKKRQQ